MRNKTRVLTDREVESRLNLGCPRCGEPLKQKVRRVRSDTGVSKYAGEFFGCSSFPSCDYYLSIGTSKQQPHESVEL